MRRRATSLLQVLHAALSRSEIDRSRRQNVAGMRRRANGEALMRCPYCAGENTQVKDSRPTEENAAIRRRRVCPDCGGRFTTFERVQLRELIVVKRSGRKVPSIATSCCARSRWRCASGRSTMSASSAWCRASCASSRARARARSPPRRSASSSWRRCAASTPSPTCALPRSIAISARPPTSRRCWARLPPSPPRRTMRRIRLRELRCGDGAAQEALSVMRPAERSGSTSR